MRGRRLGCVVILALLIVVLLAAGGATWQQFQRNTPLQDQIDEAVASHGFDLLRYEVTGVLGKVGDAFRRLESRLTPEEQRLLVEQYNRRAHHIAELETRVNRIYADPDTLDPAAASTALRQQLERQRQLQRETRPLVEAILERQTAMVLDEMNLTRLGLVWPPVRFQFSAPPNYLIVSPRDRIELEASTYLDPDLDFSQITAIEETTAAQLDRSTLIEGLGGVGVWPTLVLDQASLPWTLSTIAHEWVHNYMIFQPLGWNMFASPEMNTINETAATIIGDEIGQAVATKFYDIPPPSPTPQETPSAPEPKTFDFAAEMRRTRVHVDELLARGKIVEAENYMEARRRQFVTHGYPLRRLNQAYFAFYGSYATGPAATDPIGPKLQRLRDLTPDLATFVADVRSIRQPADLDRLLEAWTKRG